MSSGAGKLRFSEKLGYCLGDAASNLFWQTFSFFLLYFYTDIFGISGAAAGTMFLISRIWDSINDPIMGIIADRTKTKWGKFRPWILWLAIPFGVIGFLTFTTPDFGTTGKLVWAYITYTLMMMIYTGINIPYSALMGVISPNSQERTATASFRFVAAFSGGMIVQASANRMVEFFGSGNEQLGWQLTMAVFAVLSIILWFITFATTKERVQPPVSQKTSLKSDLKELVQNVPWLLLFIIGIFLLTFVSIRNGVIMFYFIYYVQDQAVELFGKVTQYTAKDMAAAFMVVGSAANIIGVILTPTLTKLMGKRMAFLIFMVITAILTAVFYIFSPENIVTMFVLQAIISFIMGPLSPILWSMYTDTADYSEWKFGRRSTGLVMSASTMAQKFGWTIGGAVSGWLLTYFGYVANVAQTPTALHGIRLMISVIPAVCILLGGGLMLFYKLDSKTMTEIEAELEARRTKEQ